MSVLYISYDGLMEPLGQSQILPYLVQLARGRSITLLTFEKPADLADAEKRARFATRTREAGIRWVPLRYHKRPSALATAYDVIRGVAVSLYLCVRYRVRIIHARSYIPAIFALALRPLVGAAFIFDMRGFWIDGRIESGGMRQGSAAVRLARWLERQFVSRADVIIVLTPAAAAVLRTWPAVAGRNVPIEIIPTCTDLELFRPDPGQTRKPSRPITFGYVGNAGPGYFLPPVLDLYMAAREIEPSVRLIIVNRNDHETIRSLLNERGLGDGTVELRSCDYPDVPAQIWGIDVGTLPVFHPNRSTGQDRDATKIDGIAATGNVPTRMGEYLGCGVPCVAYGAPGSAVEVLEQEGVGHVLRSLDSEAIRAAAEAALDLARQPGISERCVEVARRRFSLSAGVACYEEIYRGLEGGMATSIE